MTRDAELAVAYSHFADALERHDAGPNVIKLVRRTAQRLASEAVLGDLFSRKED